MLPKKLPSDPVVDNLNAYLALDEEDELEQRRLLDEEARAEKLWDERNCVDL